jgi:hypothetical protein
MTNKYQYNDLYETAAGQMPIIHHAPVTCVDNVEGFYQVVGDYRTVTIFARRLFAHIKFSSRTKAIKHENESF